MDPLFRRAATSTVGLASISLVANLVSGLLIARSLGADGRGAFTAILVAPNLGSWVFSMGAAQAIAYHQARNPPDSGRLISTWLLMALPLAAVAVAVVEVADPLVLAAQPPLTIFLARLFGPLVVVGILAEIFGGVLLGDQDFLFYNLLHFFQPAVIALGYVVLWRFHRMNVLNTVGVASFTYLLGTAASAGRVLRRHRLEVPDVRLGLATLWYGLRAHTNNAGLVANGRLDLLILPAYVTTAGVGLYSVATNVSWILVTTAGALYILVLPMAARAKAGSAAVVIPALQATLLIAGMVAIPLELLAGTLLRLVYGGPFASAATALRWLVPGCLFYAGAHVLWSGLSAINRPGAAALTQLPGVAITVGGLTIFLASGGIVAAAVVSTVAYAVVFAVALALFKFYADLRWRDFVSLEHLHLSRPLFSPPQTAPPPDD